jgi:hypothetical protein
MEWVSNVQGMRNCLLGLQFCKLVVQYILIIVMWIHFNNSGKYCGKLPLMYIIAVFHEN